MRKTLLTCLAGLSSLSLFAQCVPSTDFVGGGLELSTTQLTPVYTCVGCGGQTRVISVQTFGDTALSVEIQPGNPPLDVTVLADFFRLDSIGGLPEGLTYTTDAAFDTTYDAVENPFGYWVNPGDTVTGFQPTSGCITIEGDEAAWNAAATGGPNNDGIYPLDVYIDARAADFVPVEIAGVVGYNTWLSDMGILLDAFADPNFTVNGIRLQGAVLQVVQSGVGIQEQTEVISRLLVFPNPAKQAAKLSFDVQSNLGNAAINLTGTDGRLIHTEQISLVAGNNSFDINLSKVESGLCLLSVQTNAGVFTTRFLVD